MMQSGNARDVSGLRRRLRAVHGEMGGLLDVLLARPPLFKGCVCDLVRRCGKPTCACASDDSKRHHGWFLMTGQGKQRRTVPLDDQERERIARPAEEYRRFRSARARWMKLVGEARELMNAIEAARLVAPEERASE
jgi:hypothetical protein